MDIATTVLKTLVVLAKGSTGFGVRWQCWKNLCGRLSISEEQSLRAGAVTEPVRQGKLYGRLFCFTCAQRGKRTIPRRKQKSIRGPQAADFFFFFSTIFFFFFLMEKVLWKATWRLNTLTDQGLGEFMFIEIRVTTVLYCTVHCCTLTLLFFFFCLLLVGYCITIVIAVIYFGLGPITKKSICSFQHPCHTMFNTRLKHLRHHPTGACNGSFIACCEMSCVWNLPLET